MSFPRYRKYKDSGVEWLGQVPEHWDVISIKWLSSVKRGASPRPIDDPKYFDDEGEFAWVRIADVSACEGVLNETTQRLSELGSSLSVKIAPGELFVSIAGTVGKPCISAIKACIHDGFVYFPTLQIEPLFLYRVFEGGVCYGGLGKWGTQLNLNTDTIGSIRVALPPADELKDLLAFLDRETGKIDELVAEQRRLMELLKEKRQAVISHAVTRGLNPAAPLKPSDIEWLGDVPAHWEVKRLHLVAGFESGMAHEPYVDDSGEFICVNSRYISTGGESRKFCTRNFSPAKKNDVLMVMSDLPNGRALAKAFFVADDAPYAVNQRIGIISPNAAHPRFLYHYLDRNPGFLLQDDGMNQTHLWNDLFRKFPTLLPPPREQEEIADFIDTELAKLDTLTGEAQRAIDLLQERRIALISAAVTGQIDVRQLAEKGTA